MSDKAVLMLWYFARIVLDFSKVYWRKQVPTFAIQLSNTKEDSLKHDKMQL